MIYIDHKYIRLLSSQLDRFKQKSDELYNFRCPICGDSQKNKYKARGYVFRKKQYLIFKCHNSGDSRSLGKLLEHVDPSLYRQYTVERWEARYESKIRPSGFISKSNFNFNAPVFAEHSPKKMLTDIGAFCLKDLPDSHEANQFVKNRKIPPQKSRGLYYIDDEEKLEKISPKYKDRIVGHSPRLLLPFCDKKGNMVGLTGRLISGKGLRYLALKFNADEEPLIFGLENWDERRNTIVVEGAFDSFFLDNCIAVGGSDFGRIGDLVHKENTTIVFDNEPRNKEVVKRMKKIISDGWTICIWPENILE